MKEISDENNVEEDREERGSLFKMTELSRNLLNSSGVNENSLSSDIDLDKLLSSGLKTDKELIDSQKLNSATSSSINYSNSGIKSSDLDMGSSFKFDTIMEEKGEEVSNYESNINHNESNEEKVESYVNKEDTEGTMDDKLDFIDFNKNQSKINLSITENKETPSVSKENSESK